MKDSSMEAFSTRSQCLRNISRIFRLARRYGSRETCSGLELSEASGHLVCSNFWVWMVVRFRVTLSPRLDMGKVNVRTEFPSFCSSNVSPQSEFPCWAIGQSARSLKSALLVIESDYA